MTEEPYHMRSMYNQRMTGTAVLLHHFDCLLSRHVPSLTQHLEKINIGTGLFASQWFITVFTYNFPFDFVVRVWDRFLFMGWKPVFRVALALLKREEVGRNGGGGGGGG